MRCTHLNLRTVVVVLVCFFVNIRHTQLMADNANHMVLLAKDTLITKSTPSGITEDLFSREENTYQCPYNANCHDVPLSCMNCNYTNDCRYGHLTTVKCEVMKVVNCKGLRVLERPFVCRYCYQTEPWEHSCILKANCNSVSTPRAYYATNCTVNDDVMCIGNKKFQKNVHCNWTGGYKWSTALMLSITLGGFGADRFYLGHWQEGIGKLFSFGGLGVWTLIDVILISLHYLGPADGSLYI